jgi:hypothetical protein
MSTDGQLKIICKNAGDDFQFLLTLIVFNFCYGNMNRVNPQAKRIYKGVYQTIHQPPKITKTKPSGLPLILNPAGFFKKKMYTCSAFF